MRIVVAMMIVLVLLEGEAQVRMVQYPVVPLYPDGSKMCDGIVVDNELILVGGEGVILRSHDGFQTWQRQRLKDGEYRTIYSIAKLDSRVWVVVGESGLCYRTTDGGEHWEAVDVGTDRTLYRVRQDSSGVVIAVGEGGVIVRSTDGGMRWEERASGTEKGLRGLGWRGDEVVVVGERGVIVRSTDRGESWVVVQEGDALGRTLYDVAATPSHWYAVGAFSGILRSSDGGQTWQMDLEALPSLDADRLRGIWFVDGQRGWIVGESAEALWQPVWETTDGGQSWSKVPFRVDTTSPSDLQRRYPITWWGIRILDGRRIVYGERSQYTIVAVEPQAGGTDWYRRVWDRIVPLSTVAGVKLEGCDRFLALLGYPRAPQLVRYDGHQWDTVSLLPVIDVWRDTVFSQYRYHGERAFQWLWNGQSVFVGSRYTNGWRSEDSGKTWEIVRFDSVWISDIFPYGSGGFALAGFQIVPGMHRTRGVCLVSGYGEKKWRRLLDLDPLVYIRGGRFFDSARGVLIVEDKESDIQLWKTSDGGKHWEQRSLIDAVTHYAGEGMSVVQVRSVKVYDTAHIDLVAALWTTSGGWDAVLISSSDGGNTWEQLWWYTYWLPKIYEEFSISLAASRPRERVIVVGKELATGTVFYTGDGEAWNVLRLPSPGRIRQLMDHNGQCAVVWRDGDLFSTTEVAPHHLLVLHFAVTGVAESPKGERSTGITVYPAPAREALMIRYHPSVAAQVRRVQLYTIDGRCIGEYPGTVRRLSVSTLPAGSYYLLVQLRGGVSHLVVFWVEH